ncbi:MAG: hypothetical protein ACJAYU_001348 [Bradymonadia bacterium]|jgi:hypothetical protein
MLTPIAMDGNQHRPTDLSDEARTSVISAAHVWSAAGGKVSSATTFGATED